MLVDEVSLTNTKKMGYVDFDFRLDFRLFFPVLAVENLYLRTGVGGWLLSDFQYPGVSSAGALDLQKLADFARMSGRRAVPVPPRAPARPAPAQLNNWQALFQLSHDPHQNYRSHKGHNNRPDQPPCVKSQQAENPTAHDGAKNPKNNVHQNAVSPAFHYLSRQPPGDQPDYDPVEKSHV